MAAWIVFISIVAPGMLSVLGWFVHRIVKGFDDRFEKIDKRFEKQDEKFDLLRAEMKEGFNKVDRRFEKQDDKFQRGLEAIRTEMKEGFDRHDKRFDRHDNEFDRRDKQFELLRFESERGDQRDPGRDNGDKARHIQTLRRPHPPRGTPQRLHRLSATKTRSLNLRLKDSFKREQWVIVAATTVCYTDKL